MKHSHKDFYNTVIAKDNEKEDMTLVQAKFIELSDNMAKVNEQRDDYLRMSNQPYSKWQAIFNLEQIKERNKPSLPKKELPKAPFFLFDMDKALLID